jgi:glycosyltransferase involved in cell wall biosynthesis
LLASGSQRIRIIRIIARLNVGGPAKHVAWLTAELHPPEFRSLLVAGTVPEGEEDMGYFAEELGLTPLFIPEMSREISPKDAVTVWKLFRLFLRDRPHIVHTHTAKAGTVGRIAGFFYRWLTPGALMGRPRRCKFVHTYHGHVFHSYYGPIRTRVFILIERLLTKFVTDRVIVVSEQQRREIAEEFQIGRINKFVVVPLGLDLKTFANASTRRTPLRQELGIGEDTLLVGIVGRLTEIKNHELFLRAAERFKRLWTEMGESRTVRFIIIGEGSRRTALEELSASLGLTDDVTFTGGRKDPENFYPALDVAALTSRNEGTPLTLIEAMANERPVIATNVGGVVDLVGEQIETRQGYQLCSRGLSVAAGDYEAFAAGLVRLAQDVDLRQDLGQRGREFVEKKYPKERLLEDIRSLYSELMRSERATTEPRATERGLQSRV